jgi:hypothetical protein
MAPEWLSLLAPVPAGARPERKPVASAEQIANDSAGPIAGWQSVSVNLSEPEYGLRHVHLTLDASGRMIAASDHVMFVIATKPDDESVATITDHESIGGRFEDDGSFRGTCWKNRLECQDDQEEGVTTRAERASPTGDQINALRRIADDLLAR